MSFTLPAFNTLFNLWAKGTVPKTSPSISNFNGQLYIMSKGPFGHTTTATTSSFPNIFIRTDVNELIINPFLRVGCVVACDDPRLGLMEACYQIMFWEILHKNFPNAYLALQVQQCDDAGVIPDARR